ncbi:MAG TPA: redoxin family protein [Candidatus Angelobacter sp.]|nr:redoxin family protein [Candidatus Angelobacter sp.]
MPETVDTKKRGMGKKIELAANIGIVITAVLVIILFVRNYAQRQNDPTRTVALGSKFALKNVNWQANNRNLVFAVSTTCHYCTESADFYRKLVEQCRQQHVHTVAVLPQSQAEAQVYLGGEGVTVDEIRQAPLSELDIAGTPTLVLVDQTGIVKHVWEGKLPSAEEEDVVTTLIQPI